MATGLKTIWHYGIMFFQTEQGMKTFSYGIESKSIHYEGTIEKLSRKKAMKIAEIHPNFEKYNAAAMMPLFKGYGNLKSGTEDPVMALESLKTAKESQIDMPYIFIWKILED